ncbi:unnamed protein product [Sphenostylis stenocarpa]|uniref:Uncharacterized protein n=1 Tax=Sphenostylis stenocarpa TaxID=92480 RepID=A0AA87B8W5_9FABA|nr:unnamed protein product [Sphenostylis stenocarpa]
MKRSRTLAVVLTPWLRKSPGSRFMDGFSEPNTPPVLIRLGPWSFVSGLPADKISEIDQPAGLVWLFLSIEKKESALTRQKARFQLFFSVRASIT